MYNRAMPEFASKIFELLKASGWQTGMLAIFGAGFLYLSRIGVLPPLEPSMILVGAAGVAICAALAFASICSGIQGLIQAGWAWWQRRVAIRRAERLFEEDIPTLSDHERRILGYLRHYRLKTFVGDRDGGYADTLIAKRYVRMIGVHGQAVSYDRVPFAVADHVWRIINERSEEFPHQPVMSSENRRLEVYPWTIPRMMR